jgi:hypothetical protein
MRETIERNQWAAYFSEFNRRNRWRPTRLVVSNGTDARELERGLPLVGISLAADHEGSTRVHILLGGHDAMESRYQTFTITGVTRVTPKCGFDGRVETLEFEDEHGKTNLLCFEPMSAACPVWASDLKHADVIDSRRV